MAFSSSIRDAMIARCVTAGISTLSSFLLVIFILESPSGLRSPYSRIIFGLSIADVLQSLGILVAPFAAPTDPEHIFGRGSVKSCDAVGFFTVIGSLAVPFYTLQLTYYFLKRVKYKVLPKDFANGEEKWFHIFIWIYSIAVASFATGKEMINPTQRGSMCYLTPSPVGCNRYDDVECIRGKGAIITGAITIVVPGCAVFLALLIVLGAFILHVYTSEKQLQPTKQKENKKTKEKDQNSPVEINGEESNQDSEQQNDKGELSALQRYQKEALELVLTKSAIFQSSLYIFTFLLVYSGSLIVTVSGFTHGVVGFWWYSILYPLGLFNIVIYTRPKVQALRKVVPEIPRFIGFIIVVLAGGETPNVLDYLSSNIQQDEDIHPVPPARNSALQRVCELFGFSFESDYSIDAEVEQEMRGRDLNGDVSNGIEIVHEESRNSILESHGGLGSSGLSVGDETFNDDNAA